MFGAKSDVLFDSTAMFSTPSASLASSRPIRPSWLNDLSSNPPVPETMQGRKPSTAPPVASVSVGVASGAEPQPARARIRPAASGDADELLGA